MPIRKQDLKGTQVPYRAGIKYLIARSWSIDLKMFMALPLLPCDVDSQFVSLTKDWVLTLKEGFFSDGPSGPTHDDESNLRTAFIHDGIYYLLRLGLLPPWVREYADKLLEEIGLADGMEPLRAGLWHQGVDVFAAGSAEVGYEPYPVRLAPELIVREENDGFGFGREHLNPADRQNPMSEE